MEKTEKIAKKRPKIALLSLYLLYLYHVWKSKRSRIFLQTLLLFYNAIWLPLYLNTVLKNMLQFWNELQVFRHFTVKFVPPLSLFELSTNGKRL